MTRLDWEQAKRRQATKPAEPEIGPRRRAKNAVWKGPYRMMFSRYAGKCVICGLSYAEGDGIGWDYTTRTGAHSACVHRQYPKATGHQQACFVCGRAFFAGEQRTIETRTGRRRHIHLGCADP